MCQPVTVAPAFEVVAEAATVKVSGTLALLAGEPTATETPAARAAEGTIRAAASARPSLGPRDRGCILMGVLPGRWVERCTSGLRLSPASAPAPAGQRGGLARCVCFHAGRVRV